MFSRILILTAMKEEELAITDALRCYAVDESMTGKLLQVRCRTYRIPSGVREREITISQSGIGPVNAALTLAAVAETRPVDGVILLGVGGALVTGLRLGDLVLSTKVLQHDSCSSLDFGNPRMAPGDIILCEKDMMGYSPTISADPGLMKWIDGSLLDRHALNGHASCVSRGTVISGNEFVGTVGRKLDLQALDPDALLVDMEAAGVAQAAKRMGLPFVVAKTVADRLHADGSIESDFRACLESSARNAADLIHCVFKA